MLVGVWARELAGAIVWAIPCELVVSMAMAMAIAMAMAMAMAMIRSRVSVIARRVRYVSLPQRHSHEWSLQMLANI